MVSENTEQRLKEGTEEVWRDKRDGGGLDDYSESGVAGSAGLGQQAGRKEALEGCERGVNYCIVTIVLYCIVLYCNYCIVTIVRPVYKELFNKM